MTSVKWIQIYDEEFKNLAISNTQLCLEENISPDTWPQYRKNMLNFISEVDKLTEVYEMENKNAKA